MALDADAGEIIGQNMTDQDAGDASLVEPLLDKIDRLIDQFTADGAYDAVGRHSADAAVVIPPRSNAIDSPKSGHIFGCRRPIARNICLLNSMQKA